MLGIFIGTAALVVLLSAFNGLESWVIRLYNSFDSDIRIEAKNTKWINQNDFPLEELKSSSRVITLAEVLEENCLVTYSDNQYVCTMKGVSDAFISMSGIDTMMVDGEFRLKAFNQNQAIVGSGIAYYLAISIRDIDKPLYLYVPKSNIGNTLNPADAFQSKAIFPGGVFEIQPEFDSRYIIVPLEFAKNLLDKNDFLSAVEIKLKEGINEERAAEEIKAIVGDNYFVKNRFEQHELLYKIINAEKWAVFLVLCFILLIAVFNVTGSLTMLVVEKSNDIRTLQSLGAHKSDIKKIFFTEGMIITIIGMVSGLAAGLLTVYLQGKYSMVLINGEDPYPVLVQAKDILAISFTVLVIGAAAAILPASRAVNKRVLSEKVI